MKRNLTRLLLAAGLALAGAATPGQNGEPRGRLRLGDLFETAPGSPAWHPEPLAFDPLGPVVFVPNARDWRLPAPTPTPAPPRQLQLPKGMDLPRLPLLISEAKESAAPIGQAAFQDRGARKEPPSAPPGARVQVATTFNRLRVEYELRADPSNPDAPDSIRFLHGPGHRDSFVLPPGQWQLRRRYWLPQAPQNAVVEVFPVQALRAGNWYEFSPAEPGEEILIQRLRR